MVIVSIGKLILEVLGSDGGMHGVGDLIVEFVQDWVDSCGLQFCIASVVPLNDVIGLPTHDWMDKDGVGVMIVEEEDIVHTNGGGEGKTSGLIRGDHGLELVKFNCISAGKMVTGNRRF